MFWAQIIIALIAAIGFCVRMAAEEDATTRVIYIFAVIAIEILYACAGTYSHFLGGWPH